MMTYLKKQKRFKAELQDNTLLARTEYPMNGAANEADLMTIDENSILETVRHEVLQGAYYLIDYRGYAGFEPGDNVVNIFAMGSMGTEAIKASEMLLERGIYANVIIVTSPDLLVGIQAHQNDYAYLKQGLGINGNIHMMATENIDSVDFVTLAGRRTPIVSVHDGEAGLLDNIGSVLGVRQECLAVRKHSKCGRPVEIYHFHEIDAEAVFEAAGKVLSETALEKIVVSQETYQAAHQAQSNQGTWKDLWPTRSPQHH